jgi:hypothetical protein
MPRVGFEPMIPVLERAKTIHALDEAANVLGGFSSTENYYYCFNILIVIKSARVKTELSLCLTTFSSIYMAEMEVWLHVFLTSGLDGWLSSALHPYVPEKVLLAPIIQEAAWPQTWVKMALREKNPSNRTRFVNFLCCFLFKLSYSETKGPGL